MQGNERLKSARLFGAGLALGLSLSLVAGRVLGNKLYGVSSTDPLVLAAMTALLGAVALAASFVPARRAARVDPLVALRFE